MREMDFSSSSQRVRVTSELVITIASSAPDSATRSMSLVRRVKGCSKLPETVTSRPSTCISSDDLSARPRPAAIGGSLDNITGDLRSEPDRRTFIADRLRGESQQSRAYQRPTMTSGLKTRPHAISLEAATAHSGHQAVSRRFELWRE